MIDYPPHEVDKEYCSLALSCIHSCTGWRRPIRCLKLQVIFRKRAANYRALLRKMIRHPMGLCHLVFFSSILIRCLARILFHFLFWFISDSCATVYSFASLAVSLLLQCDASVYFCSVLLQCAVAVCCCSVLLQCAVAVCCCSVVHSLWFARMLPCFGLSCFRCVVEVQWTVAMWYCSAVLQSGVAVWCAV